MQSPRDSEVSKPSPCPCKLIISWSRQTCRDHTQDKVVNPTVKAGAACCACTGVGTAESAVTEGAASPKRAHHGAGAGRTACWMKAGQAEDVPAEVCAKSS